MSPTGQPDQAVVLTSPSTSTAKPELLPPDGQVASAGHRPVDLDPKMDRLAALVCDVCSAASRGCF
jgi:hypothetical protein